MDVSSPPGLRRLGSWAPLNRNDLQIGAQEGTRTLTPYGTRPSNVCVYQFHHLSILSRERVISGNRCGCPALKLGFYALAFMGNLPGGRPSMKLDAIKAALLASYETDGGINHLDGVNLPSQESVNEIARQCIHLLFPGYFEERRLSKKDIPDLVDSLLEHIGKRLEVEIEKCLRFSRDPHPASHARALTLEALGRLPDLRKAIRTDVEAAYQGDPAARNYEEIILAYPCVLGISLQRFAHVLYNLGVPLLPRMITEFANERTGMDIHPGARIGTHFFIDHGPGVVIGETASSAAIA